MALFIDIVPIVPGIGSGDSTGDDRRGTLPGGAGVGCGETKKSSVIVEVLLIPMPISIPIPLSMPIIIWDLVGDGVDIVVELGGSSVVGAGARDGAATVTGDAIGIVETVGAGASLGAFVNL
jgi:hypothetical protein